MKTLVLGLVGVANVLAAFAEGGTAIDVAVGQTNKLVLSMNRGMSVLLR